MKTKFILIFFIFYYYYIPLHAQIEMDADGYVTIGTTANPSQLTVIGSFASGNEGAIFGGVSLNPFSPLDFLTGGNSCIARNAYAAIGHYPKVESKLFISTWTSGLGYMPTNNFLEVGHNVSSGTMPKNIVRIYGSSTSYTLHIDGKAYCTSGIWEASDSSLKTNIQQIESATKKLSMLTGRSYEFKSNSLLAAKSISNLGIQNYPDTTITINGETIHVFSPPSTPEPHNYPEGTNYGLLAQEVKNILPELVNFDENSGLYAINYVGFIPILIEGFKEQQTKIDSLSLQLEELKKQFQLLLNSQSQLTLNH